MCVLIVLIQSSHRRCIHECIMYCLRVVEGFIGKLQPRNQEDACKVLLLAASNLLV